ncbi:hypothetical protein PR048_023260 [Dryococelus australis]|uniref:Uncharacterized protein n=1 Tax=Dryococelus australis TaxID=614101 RepID=A0ABQ9GTK7_9NEOP|nr:hypothetical protein PR048_023260 [Dryococelus australis]
MTPNDIEKESRGKYINISRAVEQVERWSKWINGTVEQAEQWSRLSKWSSWSRWSKQSRWSSGVSGVGCKVEQVSESVGVSQQDSVGRLVTDPSRQLREKWESWDVVGVGYLSGKGGSLLELSPSLKSSSCSPGNTDAQSSSSPTALGRCRRGTEQPTPLRVAVVDSPDGFAWNCVFFGSHGKGMVRESLGDAGKSEAGEGGTVLGMKSAGVDDKLLTVTERASNTCYPPSVDKTGVDEKNKTFGGGWRNKKGRGGFKKIPQHRDCSVIEAVIPTIRGRARGLFNGTNMHANRVRLERPSQNKSSDTHKTPCYRVKRCRERKISIKATELVNAKWARLPAGLLPDFRVWSMGRLGDLSFPSPLHTGAASFSPCFTLIGSQDIDVKSCPELNHSTPYLVVRLLASHLGEPGSIPGGVASGFSDVGVALYDAAGLEGFLGDLPILPPSHCSAAPYSPHFTIIVYQDLEVKRGPNLYTHHSVF